MICFPLLVIEETNTMDVKCDWHHHVFSLFCLSPSKVKIFDVSRNFHKPFSDIFFPQFSKTNGLKINLPHIKLEEHGYATEEDVLISLKRAISRYSTLQAHDGHWPGDYAGTLFLLPSLVTFSFAFKKNNF